MIVSVGASAIFSLAALVVVLCFFLGFKTQFSAVHVCKFLISCTLSWKTYCLGHCEAIPTHTRMAADLIMCQ